LKDSSTGSMHKRTLKNKFQSVQMMIIKGSMIKFLLQTPISNFQNDIHIPLLIYIVEL
jgi:hypothetical protein